MLEFYTNLIRPYPYEKLALVNTRARFRRDGKFKQYLFRREEINGSRRLRRHSGPRDSAPVVRRFRDRSRLASPVVERRLRHLFWKTSSLSARTGGRSSCRVMLKDKEIYLKANGANSRPIYDPAITDLYKLLSANNYQKGGWVLHMLAPCRRRQSVLRSDSRLL